MDTRFFWWVELGGCFSFGTAAHFFSSEWFCLAPAALAIGLALWTRHVVPSLLAGVWAGALVLSNGNPLRSAVDTLERVAAVFGEGWQTKVILFTLGMGALLALMQRMGGVEGFTLWMRRWPWSQSRRGAQMLAWTLGLGVFVESTITCLVAGTVARPLFDRVRISREKLAYLCDTTSAPVCVLIPINGWGAMILGLLQAQAEAGHLGGASVMTLFLGAICLNFYAFSSVLLAFAVAWSGRDFGPMRRAEERARNEGKLVRDGARVPVDWDVIGQTAKPGVAPAAAAMLAPMAALLAFVVMGVAATGAAGVAAAGVPPSGWMDYLRHASGSTAVFWGVCGALVVAVAMAWRRRFAAGEIIDLCFRGAGGLLPLAAIMALAFAIGKVCNDLGTGTWIAAQTRPFLSVHWIAPILFVASAVMAFSTGTSWGTFAIMIPLAAPLAASFEAGPLLMPLVLSAVLGGGVFGDHASPISDTTIVSSLAASCDHIDHVRTQLPYALAAAGFSLAAYAAAGWLLF